MQKLTIHFFISYLKEKNTFKNKKLNCLGFHS